MAQGTLILFDEFAESIGDGRIDLDTDSFAVALTSDSVTADIAKTDAIPHWGGTGTTDMSANEVAATGGYSAGGITIAAPTWVQTAGVAKFDHNAGEASITWTASGSDPANIKTGFLYKTTGNKDCIGYMDMTADAGTTAISLLAGDITITWGAGGIFTVTNP